MDVLNRQATVGYSLLMKTAFMTNGNYSVEYIYNLMATKFVKIYSPNYLIGLPEDCGTGTIVNHHYQPFIVTNEHVTTGHTVVYIQFNHETDVRAGQVVYRNHNLDLALIWVPDLQFDMMVSACSPVTTEPEFGDEVISVGFSQKGPIINMGYGHTVCTDSLGPLANDITLITPDCKYLMHTAGQYPGFSGGPTMNLYRQLVAINCIANQFNEHNYSILATNLFKNFVDIGAIFRTQHIARRQWEHSLRLGLTIKWSPFSGGGALVYEKFCNTLGNQNLDKLDIIEEINGQKVRSLDDFMSELSRMADDTDIPVLIRDDKRTHIIRAEQFGLVWV
ncbi:uncharacterized protein LOC128955479 [Oppia nitens]|uniref:uncharacterized protein LOC128955479 n=1 Tax=Oppia nitens TaxID=1686743 RepID=UPI0023DC0B36|nr:uncharacterized protein LOC128955479 [Oppia nitens]